MNIDELRIIFAYNPTTGILRWTNFGPLATRGKVVHTLQPNGSLLVRYKGSYYDPAQIAYALHHGEWTEESVYHRNGSLADLRAENLTLKKSQSQPWNTTEAQEAQTRALERILRAQEEAAA